jgi:erythromycin esterase
LNTLYAQVADAQNTNGTDGPRQLAAVQSAVDAADQVIQHLDSSRAAYAGQASAADIEWILQNGRVVRQATYGRTGDPNFRDLAMAQNAEWILRQAPAGAKILLWAHDGHIRKSAGWMGGYLAAAHGQDYFAISQLFHAGQYNARGDDGQSLVPPVVANTADSSEPGSLEYAMHATGAPRLILNLRSASRSEADSVWLLGGLQVRSIGAFAKAPNSFYLTFTETQDFDAVIFFDQAHASELLPF